MGHDDTYWCPVSRQVDGTFDRCSVLNLAGGPNVLVLRQFEVGFVAAHAPKQAVRLCFSFVPPLLGRSIDILSLTGRAPREAHRRGGRGRNACYKPEQAGLPQEPGREGACAVWFSFFCSRWVVVVPYRTRCVCLCLYILLGFGDLTLCRVSCSFLWNNLFTPVSNILLSVSSGVWHATHELCWDSCILFRWWTLGLCTRVLVKWCCLFCLGFGVTWSIYAGACCVGVLMLCIEAGSRNEWPCCWQIGARPDCLGSPPRRPPPELPSSSFPAGSPCSSWSRPHRLPR